MDKLLRCPFCGGKGILEERLKLSFVHCWECGAETKPVGDKLEAIAAWNRRVTQNNGKKECSEQGEEQ